MSTGEPAGEGGGGGGGRSTPGGDHSTGTPVGAAGATPGSQSGTQHPPPSPLSGCYLLVVLPEPHTAQHKDLILNRLGKGFLSWDKDSCHVDLEKELQALVTQAPEGEEARNGERLIQYATENLVTEVLIHPQTNTLLQCIRNLLASFTKHRHIIHAGYTFSGNGSWILQDGTFSLADFLDAFSEHDVQRVLRAYENSVTVDIHCANVGDWTTQRLAKENCTRSCRVRVNPDDVLTAGVPAIASFTNYVGQYLVSQTLDQLMEPSDVVGNIRFSHPTLYVFPGGQGDAALFGINGFNMLVDGGFARKSCFWDFARHLDRLDAVLLTRINNSNIGGMSSVLRKKQEMHVYPQIGHFFCNLVARRQANSPDGDKDVDPLILNLTDIGQEMMVNLRHINLRAHPCYRDLEPINLYHKVGHGTLDMYILSPSKDAREVRDFLAKWHSSDSKLFAGSHKRDPNNVVFPIQNLVSICALLVWQPANPEDTITRILFPGSTPQVKIFEGLERLKHLEFMRHPVCSARTLSPSTSLAALKEKSNKQKTSILERSIDKEKEVKKVMDYKKEKKDPETKPLKTAEEPAAVVKPSVPIIPTKQPAKVEVKETKSKKVVENKKIIERETKVDSKKTDKEVKTEVKKMEKETKEIKKEAAVRKEVGKVEKHEIETKKTDIIKTETEKTVITKESKPKPEPKKKEVKESKPVVKTKTETVLRQAAKPAEKKAKVSGDKKEVVKSSPTTPKKMVNGTATTRAEISKPSTKTFPKTTSKTTTSTMPAKSAKDANNRKVVESKNIALSSQPPSSTVSSAPTTKTPSVTAKPKATERKPISRRPKTGSPIKARLPGSPAKSTRSTPTASVKSDKDGVIRRSKGDKGTTDSSTVSTPSAVDAESVVKLIDTTLTEKSDDLSIDSIESKVLADLKEEREVVEEIEAVLCKAERIETARKEDQLEEGDDEITAEATDKKDDATEDDVTAEIEDAPKKIGSRKESQEFTEEDEYLIVEKEEIYTEDSVQSGEGEQKHLLDEVESEKVKKHEISKDLDLQEEDESEEKDEAEEKEKDEEPEKKIKFHQQTDTALMEKPTGLSPEHKEQLGEEVRDIIAYATKIAQKSDERDDSGKRESEDATTKEPSSSSRDRLDSSEKKTTDSDVKSEVEPRNLLPEKREESQDRISTLESGATTTAPTLPEDERIPLDEIKEVVDEKHFPQEVEVVKTKEPEVSQPPPPTTIKSFDIREPIPAVQRDIVKTPDEVADLPMHEEVDPKLYQMDDFEKGKEEKVPETPETKEPPTPPVKEQKGMFSFFGKVADKFEKGIDKLTRKTKKDTDRDSDEKSSKSSSPKETKPHEEEPVAGEIDMDKVFAKVGKLEPLEAFEKAKPQVPADIKVASIKETATFLQQEIKETQLDSVPGIQRDLKDDVKLATTEQQTPSKFDEIPKDVMARVEEQIVPLQEKIAEAPKMREEIPQQEIDPVEDTKEVEALLEEASKKFITVKDSLRDSLESLEDKIEDGIVDRLLETEPPKDLVKNTLTGVAERLEEILPRDDESSPDTKIPEKVKFEIEKDSEEVEDESEEYAGPYRDVKEAVRDVGEVLAGTAGIEIDDKPKDVIEIVKKVAEVLKEDDLLLDGILLDDGAKDVKPGTSVSDVKPEEIIIMPKKVGITEEFPPQEELEEMLEGGIARPLPVYERAGGAEVVEEPCIKVVKDKVDITSPVSQDDKSLGRDVQDLCEDLMKDQDAGLKKPSKDEVTGPKQSPKEEKRVDVMDAGIEEVCTRKEAKREIYKEEDDVEMEEEIEQPEISFEQKLSPGQAEIVMVTPDSAPTSPKFSTDKVYEKELEDAAKDDVPEVSEIPADIKEFIASNADVYDIIGEVIVKGRKISIEIIEYIVIVKKVSREHVIYIIEEIIINKGIPPESVVENIELLKGQESRRDLIPLTKRIEIEEYIVTEYIAKGKRITVQVVEEIAIKKVVPKRIVIEIIEDIIIKRKISRESVYEMIEEDFIKQVRPIYDEYDRPSERKSPTDKLATGVEAKPSIDDITRDELSEHPTSEEGHRPKPVEEIKDKSLLSPVGATKERKTEIFDEKDLDEGKLIDDFVNIPSKDAVTSFLLEERRSSDEDKIETAVPKSSVTKEFIDDSMKDSGDDFEAVEQEYRVVKSTSTPFDGVTKLSEFDDKDEEDIMEAIEDDIDEVVEAAEKFVEETKEKSSDRKESVQYDEKVTESVVPDKIAKEIVVDKDMSPLKAVRADLPATEIDDVIQDVDDTLSDLTDATEKYLIEGKEKTTGVKTDKPKVSTDPKEILYTVKDKIEEAMKDIDKKLPATEDIIAEVVSAKTGLLDKEEVKPDDQMRTTAEKYSPVDESASKLSTPEKPIAASITDHPSSMKPEIPEMREVSVLDEPDKKQADITPEKILVSDDDKKPDEANKDKITDAKTTFEETVPEIVTGKPEKKETVSISGTISPVTDPIDQTKPTTEEVKDKRESAEIAKPATPEISKSEIPEPKTDAREGTGKVTETGDKVVPVDVKDVKTPELSDLKDSEKPEDAKKSEVEMDKSARKASNAVTSDVEADSADEEVDRVRKKRSLVPDLPEPISMDTPLPSKTDLKDSDIKPEELLKSVDKLSQAVEDVEKQTPKDLADPEAGMPTHADKFEKLPQSPQDDGDKPIDEASTVRRMVVTASSEDGGQETELCPTGSITFTKAVTPDDSLNISTRSTPEKDSLNDISAKSTPDKDSLRDISTKSTPERDSLKDVSPKSTPDRDSLLLEKDSLQSDKSTPEKDSITDKSVSDLKDDKVTPEDSLEKSIPDALTHSTVPKEKVDEDVKVPSEVKDQLLQEFDDRKIEKPTDTATSKEPEEKDQELIPRDERDHPVKLVDQVKLAHEPEEKDRISSPAIHKSRSPSITSDDSGKYDVPGDEQPDAAPGIKDTKPVGESIISSGKVDEPAITDAVIGKDKSSPTPDINQVDAEKLEEGHLPVDESEKKKSPSPTKDKITPELPSHSSVKPKDMLDEKMQETTPSSADIDEVPVKVVDVPASTTVFPETLDDKDDVTEKLPKDKSPSSPVFEKATDLSKAPSISPTEDLQNKETARKEVDVKEEKSVSPTIDETPITSRTPSLIPSEKSDDRDIPSDKDVDDSTPSPASDKTTDKSRSTSISSDKLPEPHVPDVPLPKDKSPSPTIDKAADKSRTSSISSEKMEEKDIPESELQKDGTPSPSVYKIDEGTETPKTIDKLDSTTKPDAELPKDAPPTIIDKPSEETKLPSPTPIKVDEARKPDEDLIKDRTPSPTTDRLPDKSQQTSVVAEKPVTGEVVDTKMPQDSAPVDKVSEKSRSSSPMSETDDQKPSDDKLCKDRSPSPSTEKPTDKSRSPSMTAPKGDEKDTPLAEEPKEKSPSQLAEKLSDEVKLPGITSVKLGDHETEDEKKLHDMSSPITDKATDKDVPKDASPVEKIDGTPDVKLPRDVSSTDEPTQKSRSPSLVSEKLDEPKLDHDQVTKDKSPSPLTDESTHKSRAPSITGEKIDERDKSSDISKLSSPITQEIKEQRKPDEKVLKEISPSPVADKATDKAETPSPTVEKLDTKDADHLKEPTSAAPAETPSQKSRAPSPTISKEVGQQIPHEVAPKDVSPTQTIAEPSDKSRTPSISDDKISGKETVEALKDKSPSPAKDELPSLITEDLDDLSKASDKLVKDQAPVMDKPAEEAKTPSPVVGRPETKFISDSELPKDAPSADKLAQKSRSPSLTPDKVTEEKTPNEDPAKDKPTSPTKPSAVSLTPVSDDKLPKEESLKPIETTQKPRSPSPASEQLDDEETLDAKTIKDRSPSPTTDKSRTLSITGVNLDTKEKSDTKLSEEASPAEKPTEGSRSPSLTTDKLDDHEIPVDQQLDEKLPSPPTHEPSDTIQPIPEDKSSAVPTDEESEKSKPPSVVAKLPDDEKKPGDKISIEKSPSPTIDAVTDKSRTPSIPSEKLDAEHIPDVKAPSDATSAADQIIEEPTSPSLAGKKPDDHRISSPSSDAPIAESTTPSISDAGKQDIPKDEKPTDALLFPTAEEITGTPKLPSENHDEHGIFDDKPSREGSVSPALDKLVRDDAQRASLATDKLEDHVIPDTKSKSPSPTIEKATDKLQATIIPDTRVEEPQVLEKVSKDVIPQPLTDKDTDEPVSLTTEKTTKKDVPDSVIEKSRSPSPDVGKTTDSDKPASIVSEKPDMSDVPHEKTTTDETPSVKVGKPADEIKKPELETTKPDKPKDFQTELPKEKSPSPVMDKAVDEVKKTDVTTDEKLDEPREFLDKMAKEKSPSPTVDQIIDKTPTASITITKPDELSIFNGKVPKYKSRSPTPEERAAKSPTKTGIDPEESDLVDAKPITDQSPSPALEKSSDVSKIPSPSDVKQDQHPVRDKVESKDESPMPLSDEPLDTTYDITAKKLDVEDVPDAKVPTEKSPSPTVEQTTGKSRSASPAKGLDKRIIPEKKSPASPTTEEMTDEPTITLGKLGDQIVSNEKLLPEESLSSPKDKIPDRSTALGFISVPEVAKDVKDVKTHEDESASPTSGVVTDKTEPSSPTLGKLQEQIPSVDTSKLPESTHDEPKAKDAFDASLPKQKSPVSSPTKDSEPSKPAKTAPVESSAEKESAKILDQHFQETEPSEKPDTIVDKVEDTVKPVKVIPEKLSVESLDVKDDKDRSHTPTSERSDKSETSSIAGDKVDEREVSPVPVITDDKPEDKSKLIDKTDEKSPTLSADSVVDKSRSPSIGSVPDEQKEPIDAPKSPSVSGDKPVEVLIPTLVQDKPAGKLDVQEPEFDKYEAKSRSPSIISDDIKEKPAEVTDKPVDDVKTEIPKGEKTEDSPRRPSSVTEDTTTKHPELPKDKPESPKPEGDQIEKHVDGVIAADKPKSLGISVSEIEDSPQSHKGPQIPAKSDERIRDEIEMAKSPLLGTDPSLSRERSPSIASDKSKSPIPLEDGAEELSRSGSISSMKSDQKEAIEQPKSPSPSTKTDDKLSKLEGIVNESFTMVDDVPKTLDEIDEVLVKGTTDLKSPRERSPSYDKTPKDRSRSHSLFDTGDRTPLGRSRAASLFEDKLDDKIAHLDLGSSRPSICEEIEDDKLHKDDGSKLLPITKTTPGIDDKTSPSVSDHGSTESLVSDKLADEDVSPAKRADIERHIIDEFISKNRKIPSHVIDELVIKQGVTRHVIIEIIEYIIVKRKIPRESVLEITEPEKQDRKIESEGKQSPDSHDVPHKDDDATVPVKLDETSTTVGHRGSSDSLTADELLDDSVVSPAKRMDIEHYIVDEFITKNKKVTSHVIDELVIKHGITRYIIIEIIEEIIIRRKIPRDSLLDSDIEKPQNKGMKPTDQKVESEDKKEPEDVKKMDAESKRIEPKDEKSQKTPEIPDTTRELDISEAMKPGMSKTVIGQEKSESPKTDEPADSDVPLGKRMDIERYIIDEFVSKNIKLTSHVIDELSIKHGVTRYVIVEIVEEIIIKRKIPRESVLEREIGEPEDKKIEPEEKKSLPKTTEGQDAPRADYSTAPTTTLDQTSKAISDDESLENLPDSTLSLAKRMDIENYIIDEYISKNKKITSHAIDEMVMKRGVTRHVIIEIIEEIIVRRKMTRESLLDTEIVKSEDKDIHLEDTKIVDNKTLEVHDAADKDEALAPTKSDEKSQVYGVKETPEIIPDSTVSLAKRMDIENYIIDEFVSKNKKITSQVIDEIVTKQGVARSIVIEIIEEMIVKRKISMDSLLDVGEIETQKDEEQSVPQVPITRETLNKDDDTSASIVTPTKLDERSKSISEHGSSESLASDKVVPSDIPLTKRKDIESYIVDEFISKKNKITWQIIEEIATKHGVSRYVVIEIIEEIVIERKISRDSLLDIPLDREEIGEEQKPAGLPAARTSVEGKIDKHDPSKPEQDSVDSQKSSVHEDTSLVPRLPEIKDADQVHPLRGSDTKHASVPETIVNGAPEIEELTAHAIRKRSVAIDDPVKRIPDEAKSVASSSDSKTFAPRPEAHGHEKIDDEPTQSHSKEPISASPEKPDGEKSSIDRPDKKIIPDVTTTSESKETGRLENEVVTITDAQRGEIEEYIIEQYISKNKKITREIIEDVVIKKMVPSYIIFEIIEEIIIKRKLSRTLILEQIDDSSSDKEDIEPTDRSATSSISDKDDTKLRISPDDRFDIATGKSTPEISSAKDQTIDFSGKSTPELKSSLLSEKYSDKSGYSTPDMRQFDEKSGKSTPDLKTEYESQFHKAFVGGMTEIRTTHITTLSGKSTPDIGAKHEDTSETRSDLQAEPSAPKDKAEHVASSSHGEVEVCPKKSSEIKTESTSSTSLSPSEDSKLTTTTSEVTKGSSKPVTTISKIAMPLPGSEPTAETSIPLETTTSSSYVTTVTSSQSEMEPEIVTRIIRREIVEDPETEVITRTIRHVTESEESEPEAVTRVIRREITDYETPETEVITRTITRHVTESEESEPEVVTRVIRREVIDSETPEKEVITRTIRHVTESEESEPEVVTRVIRREITDYETPETEVITRTITRHVTESEESEPEVVTRVIRREVIDSETPEKEVITRTVRRVVESEEDEPEIVTKVIRREITDFETPEREVITRTVRHVEEFEESEPEVVTRIIKRKSSGPLDEAVTITTRTTKVIEQEDPESDYSDDPSEFVSRKVKLDGQPEVIKRIISREGTPEVTETVTTKTTRTIVSEEVPTSETVMKTTTTTVTSDIEKPEVVTRTISREGTPEFSETIKRTTKTITSESGPEYVTKIISREGTPDILKTADVKRIVTTVTTITGPDGESITTKDVKESSDKLEGEDLLEKLIDSSYVDKSGKSTSDVKTTEERFVSETPEGLKTEEIIKRTVTTVTSTSGISTPDVKTFIDSEKSTPERTDPEDVGAPSKEPTPELPVSSVVKDLIAEDKSYSGKSSPGVSLPKDTVFNESTGKSTPEISLSPFVKDGGVIHQPHLSGRSTPDRKSDGKSRTATPEGFRSGEVIRTIITTTRTISEDGEIITTTKEVTEATNEQGQTVVLAEKTNVKVEDSLPSKDAAESAITSVIGSIKASESKRGSSPASDVASDRDLGPMSPRSDVSSGHSRGAIQVWESSEERHTYSDDEPPSSPLSATSQLGYSPRMGRYELPTDRESPKFTEFSSTTMTGSFYGDLPKDSPSRSTIKSSREKSGSHKNSEPIPIQGSKEYSSKRFYVEKDFSEGYEYKTESKKYVDDADLDFDLAMKGHKERLGDGFASHHYSNGAATSYANGTSDAKHASPTEDSATVEKKKIDPMAASFMEERRTSDDGEQKDKDPLEGWGKPLCLPSPKPPKQFNLRRPAPSNSTETLGPESLNFDVVNNWGEPLRLPSPAPPTNEPSNKGAPGTPKKERKQPKKVVAENNKNKKRSESPSKNDKKTKDSKNKVQPVYMDLTYVPHHGNSYYSNLEFFKRIRARYYVFSGTEPSREVYDALLEAKKTWEDKNLEVTMIPTYDTDTLGYWVADNEEALAANHIDLSPSASRCTINLQDHETSCSAYRLEF